MSDMEMNVPSGWKRVDLGSIISNISDGGTPSRAVSRYFGGSIPWIVIDDIEDNIYETKEHLTELGLLACSSQYWKEGTVILSTGATIGVAGITRVKAATKQGICGIEFKNFIDNRYMMYLLKSMRNIFLAYSQGSTIREIRPVLIKKIEVQIPQSLDEQRQIARILSKVDEAISQAEQLIAKYHRLKTGLMQDLLTKGIDEHGNIRSEETHAFKDSPLGRIPEDWEVDKLMSFISYISYGFTNPMPESPEGPYLVTAANINQGRVLYETSRKTTAKAFKELLTSKSRPQINDVLITKDGSIGRLAIVDREGFCINQSVAVMRARAEKIDFRYFKMLLESSDYQSRILFDSGGSTIKHIYITKIDKMLIAVPADLQEQNRILSAIATKNQVLGETEGQLAKLQSLKAGLMQDLLSGKVRVEQLIRETAEV